RHLMFGERRKPSIFDLMREYMEELEKAVKEMFETSFECPSWDLDSSSLEPLFNVFVTSEEVIVTADLPYAKPETVKINAISEDKIEIFAKMRVKVAFEDFKITHRRGEFSSFRCQVPIPVPVEITHAKANLNRGILEIRMPRKKGYEIKVE
ncbi:MAG: Hsp20/alpha crystallin family protein, partial [Candidatus Bathyarchaeia archaeon]